MEKRKVQTTNCPSWLSWSLSALVINCKGMLKALIRLFPGLLEILSSQISSIWICSTSSWSLDSVRQWWVCLLLLFSEISTNSVVAASRDYKVKLSARAITKNKPSVRSQLETIIIEIVYILSGGMLVSSSFSRPPSSFLLMSWCRSASMIFLTWLTDFKCVHAHFREEGGDSSLIAVKLVLSVWEYYFLSLALSFFCLLSLAGYFCIL